MPNRKITWCAAFYLMGLGLSRAHLGETEAQCIARYGSEFDPQVNLGYDVVGDKAASFHVKGPEGVCTLKVIFFNGLAAHETYANADDSQGLSEDEMKAILNLESAGLKWEKRHSSFHTERIAVTYGEEDWLRSDGATAKFWLSGKANTQAQSGEVELSTREYDIDQSFLDKKDGN